MAQRLIDIVIPSLAASLAAVHTQRRATEAAINTLLEAHPLSEVLTSMLGVGVRTAAVLLVAVGDATSFPTAARLASYAGLAPTTEQSGTSIHGEHAPGAGTGNSNERCSRPPRRCGPWGTAWRCSSKTVTAWSDGCRSTRPAPLRSGTGHALPNAVSRGRGLAGRRRVAGGRLGDAWGTTSRRPSDIAGSDRIAQSFRSPSAIVPEPTMQGI